METCSGSKVDMEYKERHEGIQTYVCDSTRKITKSNTVYEIDFIDFIGPVTLFYRNNLVSMLPHNLVVISIKAAARVGKT